MMLRSTFRPVVYPSSGWIGSFSSSSLSATTAGAPPTRRCLSMMLGIGCGGGASPQTARPLLVRSALSPYPCREDERHDDRRSAATTIKTKTTTTVTTRGFKHWAQRRQVLRKRFVEQAKEQRTPSLGKALTLPTSYSEMDNSSLVVLGSVGVHEAHKEILKRHIMTVDRCNYDVAQETYAKMSKANKEYMFVLALPYQIGIATAITAGFVSLPMVFHYGTAEWFNHYFVTSDMPEPKDLETLLEVGSWTWGWNEPVIGTLSFFLLTFQFSRSQLDNLGVKPYTHKVKQWRAERLAEKFPQYDINVVMNYSKSSTIHSSYKNYTY